jgi:hypothetical protein
VVLNLFLAPALELPPLLLDVLDELLLDLLILSPESPLPFGSDGVDSVGVELFTESLAAIILGLL